jgi:hypothetical protein
MLGAATTVIDRLSLPVPPRLSVTKTVKLDVATASAAGVPLITPVEESSDSPSGRAPESDVIDQEL